MPPPVWGLLGCCFLCGWALGGLRPLRSLPPLSSHVRPGYVPEWGGAEGADAALAFLYSGDAQQLLGANCSERYEAQGAEASPRLPPILARAAGTLTQAANFLNMLLQANDIRESSVEEDVEWYQALVRSVAEGDPRAYRARLTFNPPPGASHLPLALQATRLGEETVLQDLSGKRVLGERLTGALASPALQKRVLTNDLGSLGSPKWPRGDGYLGELRQVRLSPPFLECQEGRLRPGWLLTLSATFYGLKPDLSPEIRGQVQMDIDLQKVDINQCASGPGWYSNTHLCDLNSTQCIPLESQGFVLGRYLCRCQPGFYGASLSRGLEENATQPTGQFGSPQGGSGRLLQCQPCAAGCPSCLDATPCLVEEAGALRAAVLACQACCMLAVFLSMLVSYRCRQSKRIRASGVVLLETILFGSLLLYFPVFILYFKPSVFRCIALRWVRLLGFAIVYGTVILKLYRVLQLFLSRTPQRGSHLSSGQQLRRLGLLLLAVLCFLAVWTVRVLDRGALHSPLVTRGHTPAGRLFSRCHHDRWDYTMVGAEMLLLCWGSFLCYATRAVPSAFHEPRYMGIALHNELLLSAAFHAARFVLVPSLHPDWTLLLSFVHTHSTVTATLALLFVPKFWKPGAPPREEMVEEEFEDELDLQRSASYFNSSTVSAWSERSLDPGDIRDELKKLYAQLEVHKTKEMAANNPHLPKKRGSWRQGLGRSFMRYLAEFPEALARQHSRAAGSPGRGSLPRSSRLGLLRSSLQEPEGPRALRKSRSACDHNHCGEQGPPLLDSLPRRKPAKRASLAQSRELAAGPPALGFRSASAHNLTVGERLPRARPASLQKSLSVMAGSGETALLVASQAYLEESYRQAKKREERKKAEAALATPVRSPVRSRSPVRRPSARRLEGAPGATLSAPPSPAMSSSSMDSSWAPGKLQKEAARGLPRSPIRHQVSMPTTALSGACLAEPRMLSPTPTLAPALIPGPAPTLAPSPALAAVPKLTQSPSFLTFICPWENAELPAKKDNVAQEGPSGPEEGNLSAGPARPRLWRALSVAVEKRGAGENGGDRHLRGEADDVDEDRPKLFSKSHSLKTPVQQGSVRSLGLAIRALTHSRSTHRERGSGERSPERDKGRASGEGLGACPRSPRLGGRKVVSKQAALALCEDEESLQNQQNAHTSRMLQVCPQEGSGEQEDRGRRTAQGQGEGKVERAGGTGPATLRRVRRGTGGDRSAERAKAAPAGRQELLGAILQHLGSASCRVAEVCPWEVPESETSLPASNKAEICPWEVSGGPETGALRQDVDDSRGERGKAPEEPEPKVVAALARKKPERLVRGQEAVCPWEEANPRGLSPQDSERTTGRSEAGGSAEAEEEEKRPQKVTGPEAGTPDVAKAERCPWEASGGGENEKPSQEGVKMLPQEKQKGPKEATSGKEEKLGRDLESLGSWERTDFRGPGAISAEAPGAAECPRSVVEVCPPEAGAAPAIRRAEICPWELGDEEVGKEMLHPGTGGESVQEEGQASRNRLFGETGEQTGKAVQVSGQQQESLSPRESTASGQLLSNGGSRATQGCPREDLGPEGKAEICPWEVSEAIEDWTSGQAPKGGESQDKEKMPGTPGIKEVTSWEKPEGQLQRRAAVCPWESDDPGGFHPQPGPQDTDRAKAGFQVSGGAGSKAAEICPWDVEDTLSAERAEICPWEARAGAGEGRALGGEAVRKRPNIAGKDSADPGPGEAAVSAPKRPERPAGEQEVTCPRASEDPGSSSQHSDTANTDRSKAGLRELDHVGGRPAEVCPWEVEEASTNERATICPWEVTGGAAGKGLEREMGSESTEQKERTPERGRLASLQEDRSKRETRLGPGQEAVCPWEDLREPSAQAPQVSASSSSESRRVAEEHSLGVAEEVAEKGDLMQDPKTDSLQEHTTHEKAPSSKADAAPEDGEKAKEEPQSVCPWESVAPAILSPSPGSERPDPPRAGSRGLASAGGRHAELCPRDAPASTAHRPEGSIKAEVCPWEGTERTPEKGVSTQSRKGGPQEEGKAPEKAEPRAGAVEEKPERAVRKQEAVGPWESQDSGGLSPPPAPPASDSGKGTSRAAGSAGARVADVCPWEAGEVLSARRAEVCPWEMSTAAAEAEGPEQEVDRALQGQGEVFLQKAGSGGTKEHCSEAAAKGSREQEAVCPWAGMDSGGHLRQPEALDTEQATVSPHGASSVGSGVAELYQWEVTDPEGNKIKGTMADICPWEDTGAPSEESGLPALTATQTETFPPRGPENLAGLSIQRPLGSFLPESKCSRPQMSQPASSFTLEGVRECQGPSGLGPRTSLAARPMLQEAEAQNSSSLTEHQGEEASDDPHEELVPPIVYPWDRE
ncbi:probable G-protein coupled receptor 179 [Pipistrellus kuhlii]|uniref:G protein-coupled receptor 179 n=1 Tax=Pipistrellus kuhlii TaxID=59472 RepID=A0A7J7SVJ2_PIPKU|nr:probable G-protein coupled receptor 179 [Pipistrellus kuhlii]KAF6292097.1 G protein-coupled receptor 179 [Pipistrellus kuhlii]